MRRPPLGSSCLIAGLATLSSVWASDRPDFNCTKVESTSIEARICVEPALAALDQKLAGVYARARAKVSGKRLAELKAMQRGWIKGRNECWKADDARACIELAYRGRIVELETRYRLAKISGTAAYICGDTPDDELVVTFFATEPPSLIAERGNQSSLMTLRPAASGSRYLGRNESLWEHHGEATITWGHQAPETKCQKIPAGKNGPSTARHRQDT